MKTLRDSNRPALPQANFEALTIHLLSGTEQGNMASESSNNPTLEITSVPNVDEVPFSTFLSQEKMAVGVEQRAKSGATQSVLAKKLREKEELLASIAEKKSKGPLQLLDLPMDVLKEIIKEVRPNFEESQFLVFG